MNLRTGTPDPEEEDGVGLGACMGCVGLTAEPELNMSSFGCSDGIKEGSMAVAAATAAEVDGIIIDEVRGTPAME